MDNYEESKHYDTPRISIYRQEYGIPGTSPNQPILASSPKRSFSISEQYSAFPTIFLFVNPRSGSHKAKQFLKLDAEKLVFNTDKLQCCMYIYNLLDINNKYTGLNNLRHFTQTRKAKVAIAGGDGSSVYLIQDIINASVPLAQVEFLLAPFGTGNDLPSYLGWGRKPPRHIIDTRLKQLRKMTHKWLKGVPSHFDLWDVEISVEEEGIIGIVKSDSKGFKRVTLNDGSGKHLVYMKRLMSCYMGIGIDGRIGLNFDKHRTTHRSVNKLVYFWEGLKKVVCMAQPKVMDFSTQMNTDEAGNTVTIYDNKNPLKSKDSVLLAMNINTYLGADCKVWKSAKQTDASRVYEPQKPHDNLLEWLTFTGYGIALERGFKGNGKKLYQGKGPFVISLKNPSKHRRVYLHIDGEHFFLTNPREIKVSLSKYTSEFTTLINKHN